MKNRNYSPYQIAAIISKTGMGSKLERVLECMAVPEQDYDICAECGEPDHDGECKPQIDVVYCLNFN